MTQVAQIFEEEKQQALTQVVIKMIRKNYSSEEIASIVSGFSREEVEALRKKSGEPDN